MDIRDSELIFIITELIDYDLELFNNEEEKFQRGHRWNSFNTKLVYTFESRALATLEVAVYLDLRKDLPSERYFLEIEIPDNILILEVLIADLTKDWNSNPPSLTIQIIGDDFVFENEAAVLKVSSSIIHQEFNYLINPNHPAAKVIKS